MSIGLFHLTYDENKGRYPNAMENVIEVVWNKCFVTEIGHPVESTFVFRMTSSDYDVEKVREALVAHFPRDFWFVISRAAHTKKRDTDSMIEHLATSPCKEHADAFFDVLQRLKDAKKISTYVRNLSM